MLTRFYYTGDDACPKCKAVYCGNVTGDIAIYREQEITCLDCGYIGTLGAFVDEFNKLHPDFADSEVSHG